VFAGFARQKSAFLPLLARPQGRLHFAGEHTESFTGRMEGAVRFGHRVAAEIPAR
jgi:monoamine oxidase